MAIRLSSTAFKNGATIPREHTCDGDDTAPPLTWTGIPERAKSLTLIVEDPDAPSGTFTHWILLDLDPKTASLTEGGRIPEGATEGRNGFGRTGYGGPCPPPGKPHRYFFRLYALDSEPGLVEERATREAALQAMEGHVLEQGEVMGTYGR